MFSSSATFSTTCTSFSQIVLLLYKIFLPVEAMLLPFLVVQFQSVTIHFQDLAGIQYVPNEPKETDKDSFNIFLPKSIESSKRAQPVSDSNSVFDARNRTGTYTVLS